eukprot:GGOE01027495.1.p1 GENE.GGOE01027495.1~~GGOE01027495.1.p1  ORF type:complete len:549 (-),score=84.74 GGOE01027495.1:237-1862(-)
MAASRRRAAAAQLLSCSGLLFIGLWLCWDGLDATGATALQTAPGGLRVARPANAVLVTPARRQQSQLLPSTPAVGPAVAVGAAGQRRAPRSPAALFDLVLRRCCWLAFLATTLSAIAVLVRRALPPSPRPTPLWVCAVQGDVTQQTSGGHLHTSGREAQQVEALEFEEAAKLRGETNVLPSKQAAGDKEPAQSRKEEQGRTVFVGHLPLTTTQAELKLSFPTAERIFIRRGRIYACAFVTFGTVEAATSVASLTKMELAGNTVSVFLQGDKETAKRRMKEEQSRTIFIGAMPLATTQAELEQSFPTAERIVLHPGKMQAFAFVVFSTVEVATKIASQGKMEVAGHPVYLDLCMAGNKEAAESRRKKEQSRTLFIGPMPLAATQAELEQRFPTAEHISIHREKLHSRAIVIFSTEEEARSVASQTKVELAGHNIDLCMRDNKERWLAIQNERTARTVVMSRLPTTVCEATLNQRYPTAEAINLVQTGPHTNAFVRFPTAEEAEAMASQATAIIDGQTVALRMAGSKKALGQKRGPPAATANA